MKGMNAQTGRTLSGPDHVRQSIITILTTPVGSRVLRRDFGSDLFNLIDHPTNEAWFLDVYAATLEALEKWEPRFRLKDLTAERGDAGKINLYIDGEMLINGQSITMDGIQVTI
ncbi:Gene 25-like lysozyme [Vibrio aerogenes CECT 7868]|uniref:Gene 25-like lysozyme n=1 Tax=Vibrio aerogenes CECT 7868 TaxID=1216006 RepID=A0A1M6B8L5_9VIBR|nr:GPW/gp25 family protein [Vibrio aerogenes]SHI44918.1 Gene 25-like lysozyme [Vibrio aerogenes CECT 7868]